MVLEDIINLKEQIEQNKLDLTKEEFEYLLWTVNCDIQLLTQDKNLKKRKFFFNVKV